MQMTTREQQYFWHRTRMRDAIANLVAAKKQITKLSIARIVHGYFDDDGIDPIDALEEEIKSAKHVALASLRRMNQLRPGVGFDVLARRPVSTQ